MTVARTDANGAGSGISPVSAPTTTDGAASTTGGLADGPNITWSKTRPVRVADASARPASLNLNGIIEALNELELAELAFVAEHNKHAKNPNAEREVYDKAKDLYKKAQIKLGEAIEKQTNRLARDSSVYPRGRGLKNCGDVRQWGQQILDRTPSPHLKSHLEEAFRENRRLCAPRALIALSQAMAAKHKLNDAQAKEGRDIIADATDAVTGKREGDDDLTREEVTKNQLDRLENLLKTIETRMDGHQRFNAVLYNELINKLRGQIDQANNGRFDTLVKEFERLVNG
jgi:hypothetical protein